MLARYDADKRFIAPTRKWRIGVASLALLAMGFAATVTFAQLAAHLSDSAYGLADQLHLADFAASPWSTWLGIPIGAFGALLYGAMIVLLFSVGPGSRSRRQGFAWRCLLVLALAAVGAAIWFVIVQWEFLGRLCTVCILGELAGALAGVAIVLQSPLRLRKRRRPRYDPIKIRRHHAVWLGGAALTILAILVTGQGVTGWLARNRDDDLLAADLPMPKPTPSRPADDVAGVLPPEKLVDIEPDTDSVAVNNKLWHSGQPGATAEQAGGTQLPRFHFHGGVYLDRRQYPILGPIDAPALALWLLDYHDPASRRMFHQMDEVRRRYGSQLAIMVIPVDAPAEALHSPDYVPSSQPVDPRDDLTALALMVFKAKPESFELFHRYLLSGDKAPTLEAARQFAGSLIGAERVRLMRDDIEIQNQLQRHVRIFKTSEIPTVPQLRAPGRGTAVTPQSPDALAQMFKFLETNLNLRPIDSGPHASAQGTNDSLP